MSPIQTLKKPYVTEKSSFLREMNQYVVEVKLSATKGQIKEEIETRFKVNVVAIRTSKVHGKFRRKTGPIGGYQSDRKKAIIRLKEGQKLTWEEAS